jgi:hypothetical protein
MPFGCASVNDPDAVREGTEANGGRLAKIADPCDVVTFDRSAVKSIRLFGDEQRTFNDRPESPELVSLGLTPIRGTYREVFDLGPSRPSPECADAAEIEDVDSLRGVWIRVRAPQGGRLAFDPTAVSATQRRPAFVFAASTADPGDCHLIYARATDGDTGGRGVVLADGAEVLIFVAGTQEGDTVLRETALALTPGRTAEPGDCTVAFGTLECPPVRS